MRIGWACSCVTSYLAQHQDGGRQKDPARHLYQIAQGKEQNENCQATCLVVSQHLYEKGQAEILAQITPLGTAVCDFLHIYLQNGTEVRRA